MLKFLDQIANLKTLIKGHFSRQHSWLGTDKREKVTCIRKGPTSLPIKRNKFALPLALTSAAHKVQRSQSLNQVAVDFDLKNQKSFGLGQIFTALCRIKPYEKMFCAEKYKGSLMIVNVDALNQYEWMKNHY